MNDEKAAAYLIDALASAPIAMQRPLLDEARATVRRRKKRMAVGVSLGGALSVALGLVLIARFGSEPRTSVALKQSPTPTEMHGTYPPLSFSLPLGWRNLGKACQVDASSPDLFLAGPPAYSCENASTGGDIIWFQRGDFPVASGKETDTIAGFPVYVNRHVAPTGLEQIVIRVGGTASLQIYMQIRASETRTAQSFLRSLR